MFVIYQTKHYLCTKFLLINNLNENIMNTRKEIKKLFEKVDETKESMLIIHVGENEEITVNVCGSRISIANCIASIVYDGLKNDVDKNHAKLAHAIIDGVAEAIKEPSRSAIKIMLRLTKAIASSRKTLEDELTETFGLNDNNDDNDDDENCETCENNSWCPLPKAVAYRKAKHIPTRKKRNKNNNKHGGCKNEDLN